MSLSGKTQRGQHLADLGAEERNFGVEDRNFGVDDNNLGL